MKNNSDYNLRISLTNHLKGGQAFATVGNLLQKVSYDHLGIIPAGLPYSFYQVFWHVRFAQLDILEYCTRDEYITPEWPEDYWPGRQAPEDREEWSSLKKSYFDERDNLCSLISNTSNDLFAPLPQHPEHNLFRQIQLVVEHTAYHTGQLHIIYRLLNNK